MSSLERKIGAVLLRAIRTRRKPTVEAVFDSSASATPAKLRPARLSDFSGVAELKRRGGLNADSPENWDRLWNRNPALAEHPAERPIGWVLEADGVIVGYLGNISLLYRYGNRTLKAVTAHGLVVDPPYRSMGVTLVAAFFRQQSVDLFVSTSAIEAVGKIARAFKAAPVPQPEYDIVLFWILRPYAFSRALMQRLDLVPGFSSILGSFASVAISMDKIFRSRRPRADTEALSITELAIGEMGEPEFAKEFDTFWQARQNESRRLLLADRSTATLQWHFEIPGDRGLVHFLVCRERGRLTGYAIVRTDFNPQKGLRVSIIADMIVENSRTEVVKALLSAAYSHAKRVGSDVLEIVGFPAKIRAATQSWTPYRRQYPACPFYFKVSDPDLHARLENSAEWYASPYDGDATLIRPSYSAEKYREAAAGLTPDRFPDASDIIKHETIEVY